MSPARPQTGLPVAVIGAGPIGLAAAVHLLARGETPLVLEAGVTIGASIRQWRHVRFFSPWKYILDAASVTLLEPTGWSVPEPERAPTGGDILERYLEPLATLPQIARHIRLGARVTDIARRGHDKLKTPGRQDAPFVVRIQSPEGTQGQVLAKAVIDASGTWGTPNPLGADGLPALGEAAAGGQIFYGIPDVLNSQRQRYAGKRVLVVGSGHSAFNALLELANLSAQEAGTEITWAVRRKQVGQLFGGEQDDALPERGRLGSRTRELVEDGLVRFTSLRIAEVRSTDAGVVVLGEHGEIVGPFDEVVCATGFRPDLSLTRELRLDLDPAVEAPSALGPLIDPSVHSCGSVPPHGADQLKHPEPEFYIVGMKSYGRAPTFLLRTGYEQVRSVVAAIAGDWESARSVELVLPETGVCSTNNTDASSESGCGAPPAAGVLTHASPSPRWLPVLDLIPAEPAARSHLAAGAVGRPTATPAEQNTCCSTAAQATCCEPADKATCCGTAAAGTTAGCGCR